MASVKGIIQEEAVGAIEATEETNVVESPAQTNSLFAALAIPDFRHLWIGSLISNVGSWMQLIGTGWLVLQLTHSPFWLGVVSFTGAVPILVLSLFAGVLADRVDRRRLLLVTQSTAGVLALLLAVLVTLHRINIVLILIITALTATAMAFNMPAWQAMIPDLVGKERLTNAVGLNSAAFNGAAVIGPAFAGLIVGTFGVSVCFYLNAISFIAVIGALLRIKASCTGSDSTRASITESLGGGLHFISHHRIVFVLFWMAAITSLLARPYLQLMPVIAESVLHGGPRTYGTLMAANGVGALAGALLTASLNRVTHKGFVLLGSALAFGIALIAFASSRNLILSLALLALIGGGTTLYMGTTNTVLLTQVTDEMRGRVMSMYSLIGAGVMPVGALVLGGAASAVANPPLVIAIGGAIVAANVLVMAIGAPALRKME